MPIGLKNIAPIGYSEREVSDAINQVNQLSLSWGGTARPVGDQYYKNEMIRDGLYTMVALRDTTDRPAPQPLGDVETDQPIVPTFVTLNNLSIVSSRHQYTLLKDGWIQSAQVWVPDIGITVTYRFILATLLPEQTIPTISQIENPILAPNQWNTIFVSHIGFITGSQISLTIEALNSAGDSTWNHPWDFQGIDNNLGPIAGFWNRNNQHTILRINDIDSNSASQVTDLQAIIVGTVIRLASTAIPTTFFEYVVDEIVDDIGFFNFVVTLLQSNAGGPGILEPCTITTLIPTPQATEFVTVEDWWIANQPSFATVVGSLEFAGLPQIGKGDDSFGIRLFFQEANVSPDWDLVAFSG